MRADKDREVYWRGAAQAIAMKSEVTVLLGKTDSFRRYAPNFTGSKPEDLHVETLAATAFALGFGVLKLECLIQALLDEIDQGSID